MRELYENEIVRIADLTVTTDVITDVEFQNCLIIGPAVIAPMGKTQITNSMLPGTSSEIFWIVEPGRDQVIGAVGVEDCVFDACRFERIGLAGPESMRSTLPTEPSS